MSGAISNGAQYSITSYILPRQGRSIYTGEPGEDHTFVLMETILCEHFRMESGVVRELDDIVHKLRIYALTIALAIVTAGEERKGTHPSRTRDQYTTSS